MTSAFLDTPLSGSFQLKPTREFYWRIGETYSQAVSRHLSEQRRDEPERNLLAVIQNINVVNRFHGAPLIGQPPQPPPEAGRRSGLPEAYLAAVSRGVQLSGRIVEEATETLDEQSAVEDAADASASPPIPQPLSFRPCRPSRLPQPYGSADSSSSSTSIGSPWEAARSSLPSRRCGSTSSPLP
jgi:hypothetical protein